MRSPTRALLASIWLSALLVLGPANGILAGGSVAYLAGPPPDGSAPAPGPTNPSGPSG